MTKAGKRIAIAVLSACLAASSVPAVFAAGKSSTSQKTEQSAEQKKDQSKKRWDPLEGLVEDGIITQKKSEEIRAWMKENHPGPKSEEKETSGTSEKKTPPEKKSGSSETDKAKDTEKKAPPEKKSDSTGTDKAKDTEKKAKPEKKPESGGSSVNTSGSSEKKAPPEGSQGKGGLGEELLKELQEAGIITAKEADAIKNYKKSE